MSQDLMSTTARIADISREIRDTVTPVFKCIVETSESNAILSDAKTGETNARETTFLMLAKASSLGQWTEQEITLAAAKAASMTNDADAKTAKSLATYIGEAKRAMHPLVRERVMPLTVLRNEAWIMEGALLQADKSTFAPLRAAFARSYHMLLALMGAVIDERRMGTLEDVYDLAAERDPTHDPKKAARKVEQAVELLQNVLEGFRVKGLAETIEALGRIDSRELRECAVRKAPPDEAERIRQKVKAEARKQAAAVSAAVSAVVSAAVAPEPEPAVSPANSYEAAFADALLEA